MATVKLSSIVLPAYRDFWNTKRTYVACKGSRGSGKSKQTALWYIFFMMKYPLSNTLVIRKVERTLRDSCYADLRWAIERLGVSQLWKCTTNPLEITYISTGQKILFRGLDSPYKITSIAVPHGVLNFLWFEEFYEIMNEEDFNTIDESIRGLLPAGYWKRVTMTFNPWSERHFAKKRFFDSDADNVLAMTTTYKDNPYLSETDIRLFDEMKIRNPRRYAVAGLGEWGITEGLIYENWREESFDTAEISRTHKVESAFGMDFGFTNDPTTLFCGLLDIPARRLYVFDELYERGLTNDMIAKRISAMGYGKVSITADGAEPKSIAELRGMGLRVTSAAKGADSIRSGIQWIQNLEIIIHPRCANFLTEISNYTWAKDKFGKMLDAPIDDFNHLMDAMRYALEKFIVNKKWTY